MTDPVPPQIAGFSQWELIGGGATSTVWRAVDDALGRVVAVKVLASASPGGERQFRNEQRLLGPLSDHPRVVTLHSVGTAVDGRPYLVSELYPSGSVKDLISTRGGLALGQCQRIVADMAAALTAAHEATPPILHRDITPANMLLRADDHAVLSDFGTAVRVWSSPAPTRTMTPSHAAPEVVAGEPYTVAAEVYSLASCAYEMLTGRPPLWREGQTLDQLLDRVVAETPPPLPQHLAPEAMRVAIAEALHKDPARRPSSIAEFERRALMDSAEAAGTIAANTGHSTPTADVQAGAQPADPVVPRRWWSRRRMAACAAAIVFGALGSGFYAGRRSSPPRVPVVVGTWTVANGARQFTMATPLTTWGEVVEVRGGDVITRAELRPGTTEIALNARAEACLVVVERRRPLPSTAALARASTCADASP